MYDNEKSLPNGRLMYGLDFMSIRNRIKEFAPDMIGISILSTAYFLNGMAIAKLAKYINKNIVIVVGGAYPSSNYQEAIDNPNVDFVTRGEGEVSTNELISALNGELNFSDVRGLVYRDCNNSVKLNDCVPILDLDTINFPQVKLDISKYFDVKDAHYVSNANRSTQMITSRGCPNDCNFCTIHDVWGYRFRARSAENVISEIELLKRKFNVDEIQFEDDNIICNRERAAKIFEKLKELNIKWSLPNGVAIKTLDREILELMYDSGCRALSLPFESANVNTLKNIIKKDVDPEYGKKVVKWCKEIGIATYGFFIVGFPGETLEDVKNTLEFSSSVGLNGVYVFYATPYPGTRLAKELMSKGYIPEDFDFHSMTIERTSFSTNEFTQEELETTVETFISKKKKEGYNYL